MTNFISKFSSFFNSSEKKEIQENFESERKASEHRERVSKVKDLFLRALKNYNLSNCQCAFPRFQQILGVDCTKTRNSFKNFDTDLLIDAVSEYFNKYESARNDENKNEIWECKKCKSTYEFGWSDFSIVVERMKLELIHRKTKFIGKTPIEKIPIYVGIYGHTLPNELEIIKVEFEEFEKYLLETN